MSSWKVLNVNGPAEDGVEGGLKALEGPTVIGGLQTERKVRRVFARHKTNVLTVNAFFNN